jgi:hypothetical protein
LKINLEPTAGGNKKRFCSMKQEFECLCMVFNKDKRGFYVVADYRIGGDYFTKVKRRMTKQEYERTRTFKEWADYVDFFKSRI